MVSSTQVSVKVLRTLLHHFLLASRRLSICKQSLKPLNCRIIYGYIFFHCNINFYYWLYWWYANDSHYEWSSYCIKIFFCSAYQLTHIDMFMQGNPLTFVYLTTAMDIYPRNCIFMSCLVQPLWCFLSLYSWMCPLWTAWGSKSFFEHTLYW